MDIPILKRKFLFFLSKYFVFIIAGLVIIVLVIGYFMFVKDRITEIQKVGLVDLQSKLDVLNSKESSLRKLIDLNNKYRGITDDQIQQLNSVLPDESEIPYLVIEIKKFINRNNLLLNSIDVGPLRAVSADSSTGNESNNGFKTLNISLGISGVNSYFMLKDFLNELSNQLPLLELTSLVYTPGTDSYSLNLTTFYR